MSYSFQPMTEEEINANSLMEAGTYDFQVMKSTRKTSKKGNPMAELQLQVWDNKGITHTVFDYLVFSQVPLNIRKVKHFCEAVGLADQYKQGQIPEELQRFCGKVEIGIQEKQEKPTGGFYDDKNVVIDYIIENKNVINNKSIPNKMDDNLDSGDIPF